MQLLLLLLLLVLVLLRPCCVLLLPLLLLLLSQLLLPLLWFSAILFAILTNASATLLSLLSPLPLSFSHISPYFSPAYYFGICPLLMASNQKTSRPSRISCYVIRLAALTCCLWFQFEFQHASSFICSPRIHRTLLFFPLSALTLQKITDQIKLVH